MKESCAANNVTRPKRRRWGWSRGVSGFGLLRTALIVASIGVGSILSSSTQVVNIPDPALAQALLRVLNKPLGSNVITLQDMTGLKQFVLDMGLVVSLEGLQTATNLTTLILNQNRVSDITPLA